MKTFSEGSSLSLFLLENLLFTDFPWIGSRFQPSKDDLPCLENLKGLIENAIKKLESDIMKESQKVFYPRLQDFLKNLENLIQEIDENIRWVTETGSLFLSCPV
ncbi:MAG: hypothetical protein A2007_04275 [Verrucomicrobia bacterium GWC2_42_7]|nr:MAG: hypothetical protein A2007_04275 [Verrucomicrobia bacterium GWC2_42_7]